MRGRYLPWRRSLTASTDRIRVEAVHMMKAPAGDVFQYISDYRAHRPNYLSHRITSLTVEHGGTGAGTVIRYTARLGLRTSEYRAIIDVPRPGIVLREVNLDTGDATTFEVAPFGNACLVRVRSEWTVPGGFRGVLARRLVQARLQDMYRDELMNLDFYSGERVVAGSRRALVGVPV